MSKRLADTVPAGAGLCLAILLLLAGPPAGAAQTPPVEASGEPDLAWLAGCWAGTLPSGARYEEWWMPEVGGLLAGMSRVSRDGRVLSFEFLRIAREGERTVYLAQPGGREATAFEFRPGGGERVVFENADHDFPQRIVYSAPGSGFPFALIEGEQDGAPRSVAFPLEREDCPAGVAPATDPPEQWYFWTDDGQRHFAFEMGTARQAGDTVVVLHGGWGAEHSYLVRPLSGVASDHRLVFHDQRGSLRSPAPDSTIRIERMVEDLEHLRRSLGLERMTIFAHSMGGALAYAYLARYPERVRGLVLAGAVHPAAFSSDLPVEFLAEVWPDADLEALRAQRDAFFEEWPERAREVMTRDGVIPEHLRHLPVQSPELWAELTDRERTRHWRINFTAVNACDPSGWREMEGGMAFYEQNVPSQLMAEGAGYEAWTGRFWPALRSFDGPVRVIMGSCDYVDPGPDIWPRIIRHLPAAELQRVEGAGHAIWMDRPDAFETEVRRALAAVRAGG